MEKKLAIGNNNSIMDFLFISMPYARFVSRWFANVPNINLGIMQAYLTEKGKKVKTFHFHLDFLPFLKQRDPRVTENLIKLTEHFGVEYMGLDYIFASILFEENYQLSQDRFRERFEALGLTVNDFEEMRGIARAFLDSSYAKLSPYLRDTKLIGFSCSHYQLSGSLLLCSMIKDIYPSILTIIGGKDCSGTFAYDLLKNIKFLDFVGTGECEVTVESILNHIGDRSGEIVNVVYRDSGGDRKASPSRHNVPINSLPFPRYDFEDLPLQPADIILPIEFGRGCPWKRCTFCPDESYNILCQAKTAEGLKREFEYYQGISKDLRNFFILDSDTLKDPRVIVEISRYLEGKDFNFIYAEFRAEKMNKETLKAILHFGNWISNFQIGIETFSDRILQLMNKGVSALKNVEVLKAAAELGVPVQFNLFTCFPKMNEKDMQENFRIMDRITHILAHDNIQIYPGEFYLPTDCPAFVDAEEFGLTKHNESIFSLAFENFNMPSYSNYPYPYQFDNEDEQYRISTLTRQKVENIKKKNPEETYMVYSDVPEGLQIETSLNGDKTLYILQPAERKIYLAAIDRIQEIIDLSGKTGFPEDDVWTVLNNLEQKGLILIAADRKSFLSLAMSHK